MIRVVVVDDSAIMRTALREILESDGDVEVVGSAADPYLARELIKETDPDVVTLDMDMPKMNGIDFLERIMRLRPTPVVMVSSLTRNNVTMGLRALEMGAIAFVSKPAPDASDGLSGMAKELMQKVRLAATSTVRAQPLSRRDLKHPAVLVPRFRKVLCIGASTGGTQAITQILAELPARMPPIVIVQHLPPAFTASFAARLDSLTRLHVKECENGETLRPGFAYVAPGGRHVCLQRSGARYTATLDDSPPVHAQRPSVDMLFASAAAECGRDGVGVILTGMGRDGSAGLRAMRDAGATTIAQDPSTCVVFGMPAAAIESNAAQFVVPLELMGRRIVDLLTISRQGRVETN